MLTQLHIQNIAVIQKAAVALSGGLNVFTGETGAGKTILISAIDAVLGERISKDIIRTGEEKATVTALFEDVSSRVRAKLDELGYGSDEDTVLISREISTGGKSVCRINGIPATASMLKDIAPLMLHIHGQRDSAQLLAGERHLHIIDTFGGLEQDVQRYQEAYRAMCAARGELDALQMDDAQKARRIDMLTFQIQEIEAATLEDEHEEQALQAQRKLIKNSEKVRNALGSAYTTLRGNGEEAGLDSLLDTLTESTGEAAQYLADLEPVARRVEEIGYELAEFAQDIRATLDDFDFDPRELDAIELRLDTIYKLRQKYGDDIAGILAYYQQAVAELEAINMSEQRVRELTEVLQAYEDEAAAFAESLARSRRKAAEDFITQVESELEFLDMPSVSLSVDCRPKPLSPRGAEDMELYIVTNVGEEPKPMSKIASGGELSRIMLAIKNVLAEKDDVATLIFDEVDSGVSGRAAQKIGRKLAQVAQARQVICVTHLAQVAACADHHLMIHKETGGGRTFTKITPLDGEQSIRELARIASGDLLTDAALQSAKELREQSKAALRP